MGGSGSGRWWGWHSKADTVEDCHALDIRWLARKAAFRPWYSGSVTWSRGNHNLATIDYTIRPDNGSDLTLVLNYRITRTKKDAPEEIEIPIALETTRPHLGGLRWWGRCPLVIDGRACNRRIAILYLPPGGRYFGCRHCYRLTYRSAQEHDKRLDWLCRNPEAIGTLIAGRASLSDLELLRALKAMDRPGR